MCSFPDKKGEKGVVMLYNGGTDRTYYSSFAPILNRTGLSVFVSIGDHLRHCHHAVGFLNLEHRFRDGNLYNYNRYMVAIAVDI